VPRQSLNGLRRHAPSETNEILPALKNSTANNREAADDSSQTEDAPEAKRTADDRRMFMV
jgi:hemerythrin-like domain-containing protein